MTYPDRKMGVILFIALFIFILGGIIGYKLNTGKRSPLSSFEKKEQTSLPIIYFDDFVGVWGDASKSGQIQWKAADSQYAERSAPIAIIHPLELRKESIKLQVIDRHSLTKDNQLFLYDQIKAEYGALLAGYFGAREEKISSVKTFDIDKDGIEEQVVETYGQTMNHPPQIGYIIKDGVIILSMPLKNGGILQTDDTNGFYVKHQLYANNVGACCATGYRLYRVVYTNGEFKPVWEQDVKYLRFN